MQVREVCHRLYRLLQEQEGGCIDRDGNEVFPFLDRVTGGVEVIRSGACERELRGAVWRLTHGGPLDAVWCLRDGDQLHVGTATTTPSPTLEGSLHG